MNFRNSVTGLRGAGRGAILGYYLLMQESHPHHDEAPPPHPKPDTEKIRSVLQTKANIPVEIKPFPRVTDPEFRVACDEIAEALARRRGFRWQIIGVMAGVLFAVAAACSGLLGVTIMDSANEQIRKERENVNDQIKEQFKTENIKSVVQQVAKEDSSELIKSYLQPSINDSQKVLDLVNQHLQQQKQEADQDLSKIREELSILEQRNQITSLGDKAIEDGDVSAYRQLRDLALKQQPPPPPGAQEEVLFVMQTFSDLGPTEFNGVTLKADQIHPGKTVDTQLDVTDLLPILKSSEAAARARAAVLLATVGKPGSYATAQALIDAIADEKNLWVTKDLKLAFKHVVSSFIDAGGPDSPDGSNVISWWDIHGTEIQKTDSDQKK